MVTIKNTKAEILAELKSVKEIVAEQEKILSEKEQPSSQSKAKDIHHQKIKQTASESSPEDIHTFRQVFNDTLMSMDKKYQDLSERLRAVDECISIKRNEIEELHDIRMSANTLEAIQAGIHQARENQAHYEAHIKTLNDIRLREVNDEIDKKRRDAQTEYKSLTEDLEFEHAKAKQRNESEFEAIKKRQDWELEKLEHAVNEKLAVREKNIADKEELLASLQEQVSGFEKLKQEALDKALDDQRAKDYRETTHKIETLKKDHQIEMAVSVERINALSDQVKDLNERNKALQCALDSAYNTNSEIANNAISASQAQKIVVHNESSGQSKK